MAATEDGDAFETARPPSGVVIPPKELRALLEKTAEFTARRGPEFDERLVEQAANNPKLQFVLAGNPYRPYFEWRKSEILEGRGLDVGAGGAPLPAVNKKRGPPEPPEFEFSGRMPTISAVDLEVVKLTALFVATHGRAWMTELSQREAQNGQFNFLRPQHSLYNFFSRLVDQYRAISKGATDDGGRPQKRRMTELEHNVRDKYHVLERAKQRSEWVRYQEAQKVRKEEQEEAEKIAYAQVDWHDFVVVGTIEFTEADDRVDLPPPTSLNDLQSASLEQKAAFSAPVNMRLEEAMPEDFEFLAGNYPPAQVPQHVQMPPPPMPYAPSPQPPSSFSPAPYTPQQASNPEEQARIAERQQEQARAQQMQAASRSQGPMRIRNDYVPRALQNRRANVQTVLCSICNQQIPSDEYDQHVKSKHASTILSRTKLIHSQSSNSIPAGESRCAFLSRDQARPTSPLPTSPPTSNALRRNVRMCLILLLVCLSVRRNWRAGRGSSCRVMTVQASRRRMKRGT